jgi:F0F1-type ATP synthase membrane subunit b/b'
MILRLFVFILIISVLYWTIKKIIAVFQTASIDSMESDLEKGERLRRSFKNLLKKTKKQ